MPYVGEWKTVAWTEQELEAAFESNLQWEALQVDDQIPVFEPAVPETIAAAVAVGFMIEQQPAGFERNDSLDFTGFRLKLDFFMTVARATAALLVIWLLYWFVRWAAGP